MKSKRGVFCFMRTFVVIAIWHSAVPVFAEIIQLSHAGYGGIFAWAPQSKFGQSFTATSDEPQVDTISIRWGGSADQSQLPAPTITAELRRGNGLDGEVLGTTAAVGPIPYSLPSSTWIDFKFSNPIVLVAGQVYTMRFNVLPTGSVAGGIGFSFSNPYSGGQCFLFSIIGFPAGPEGDLDFRVLSSPEPSSVALLAVAACGLLTWNRRPKPSL